MNNLPVKGSTEYIKGMVMSGGNILLVNSNGYIIKEIHWNINSLEGLAASIASLVTEARDQGFKQGQACVRYSLGL